MRKGLLILVGVLVVSIAFSQVDRGGVARQSRDTLRKTKRILGDTIKASYNALTTRYTYESLIKNDIIKYEHPDTIPDNFHRFTDMDRNQNFIQNLGNIGTALRPLFYTPQGKIGTITGYSTFDQFYTDPDEIRYFDTRSPYSDVKAYFGGGGRARTDLIFTANDSTHLNFGFGYKGIRADKQLAFLQRGDRNVENSDWNIFAYLRPERVKGYTLLFNLTQMKHTVTELGGIIPLEFDTGENPTLFDYQDENVILSEATSLEKRGGLHAYQQLQLDSAFQVYHSLDYYEQLNRYTDDYDITGIDSLIYKNVVSEDVGYLDYRTTFKEFKNEFGLKGKTSKFAYSAFYKLRNLRFDNNEVAGKTKLSEHFIGGTLRQQISKKIFLSAKGEFLLDGNYSLIGDFTS